jgi:hypothetical protein
MQPYNVSLMAYKPSVLSKYPVAPLFQTLIANKLRNGIGHHSAHFVLETDEILFYDFVKSKDNSVGAKLRRGDQSQSRTNVGCVVRKNSTTGHAASATRSYS